MLLCESSASLARISDSQQDVAGVLLWWPATCQKSARRPETITLGSPSNRNPISICTARGLSPRLCAVFGLRVAFGACLDPGRGSRRSAGRMAPGRGCWLDKPLFYSRRSALALPVLVRGRDQCANLCIRAQALGGKPEQTADGACHVRDIARALRPRRVSGASQSPVTTRGQLTIYRHQSEASLIGAAVRKSAPTEQAQHTKTLVVLVR
jgi:hypothetical protein